MVPFSSAGSVDVFSLDSLCQKLAHPNHFHNDHAALFPFTVCMGDVFRHYGSSAGALSRLGSDLPLQSRNRRSEKLACASAWSDPAVCHDRAELLDSVFFVARSAVHSMEEFETQGIRDSAGLP